MNAASKKALSKGKYYVECKQSFLLDCVGVTIGLHVDAKMPTLKFWELNLQFPVYSSIMMFGRHMGVFSAPRLRHDTVLLAVPFGSLEFITS